MAAKPQGKILQMPGGVRPGLPPGPPCFSKAELSAKVALLERLVAQLVEHQGRAHGAAEAAIREAQRFGSFLGGLFRTLVRKGLVTQKDFEETLEELKKEQEVERLLREKAPPSQQPQRGTLAPASDQGSEVPPEKKAGS